MPEAVIVPETTVVYEICTVEFQDSRICVDDVGL
jgi:hypothetical protein